MEFDNKDNIRNLIIQKASALFLKQGYTKTTIRQIADACNLGRGHLYYYFKKKEEIVLYLYKNLIEKIYAYIIDHPNKYIDPLLSYAITQYIYIKVIATNDDFFRMYIEASEIYSIRKEYLKTLSDILNSNLKKLDYDFKKQDINLSLIIGSAGEDTLLRRFYKKDIDLNLDEIIESTIKTRLLLLNINHEKVNEIILKTKEETKNIKIYEIIKNINIVDI
ncbi:TetR/AcrR family transcriptional regulator [[Eubacterium] tenue]|nr:TetR/AcrR family transcriptional regulator [[Eubacterium] tenue]MBC8631743.1 TetR/AcrR family transcriptional regulator [[Eubacterium] tenue]